MFKNMPTCLVLQSLLYNSGSKYKNVSSAENGLVIEGGHRFWPFQQSGNEPKPKSEKKWIRVTAEPSRTRVQTVARTSDTAARSSAHFYFMYILLLSGPTRSAVCAHGSHAYFETKTQTTLST